VLVKPSDVVTGGRDPLMVHGALASTNTDVENALATLGATCDLNSVAGSNTAALTTVEGGLGPWVSLASFSRGPAERLLPVAVNSLSTRSAVEAVATQRAKVLPVIALSPFLVSDAES